jgi:ribosomal protein L37AE/L43A
MREYEVTLHVTAPDDLNLDEFAGLRFIAKENVTYYRESIVEMVEHRTNNEILGCPCCQSRDTHKAHDQEPIWECNHCGVEFETIEGLK